MSIGWKNKTFLSCENAKKIINERNRENMDTVIFDIDGTLIENEEICIISVINLYNYIKQKGYILYIITARLFSPENVVYTKKLLDECGIYDYYGLFMRPGNDLDLYGYKESRRKYLHDIGLNIIMSVGDMPFDFGKYGGTPIVV